MTKKRLFTGSVKVFFYHQLPNSRVHLTEVILPQGTQEIQERAFLDCSSITRIEIPSSLAYVGSLAFQYCSSLQGLNIPEGCVYEDDAFDWAFGLLREE